MQTLLATLLSSRVPFVHFDEQATPRTVSPEARLLFVRTRTELARLMASDFGAIIEPSIGQHRVSLVD